MLKDPLTHPAFAFYTSLYDYLIIYDEHIPTTEKTLWRMFNEAGDTLLALRPEALHDILYLRHRGLPIEESSEAKVICQAIFNSLFKFFYNMAVEDLFCSWLEIANLERKHFILCEIEPVNPEQLTTIVLQTDTPANAEHIRYLLRFLQTQIGPDVAIFLPMATY